MTALTVPVPPCLFPGHCAHSIITTLQEEKKPSSCCQKSHISSLPLHSSSSTPPLSTVTSCPSFLPSQGFGFCFCFLSLKTVFCSSTEMQFSLFIFLSQLLHPVGQYLRAYLPKVGTPLASNPKEGYQALPAAEGYILTPELPQGPDIKTNCLRTAPDGAGDCLVASWHHRSAVLSSLQQSFWAPLH